MPKSGLDTNIGISRPFINTVGPAGTTAKSANDGAKASTGARLKSSRSALAGGEGSLKKLLRSLAGRKSRAPPRRAREKQEGQPRRDGAWPVFESARPRH